MKKETTESSDTEVKKPVKRKYTKRKPKEDISNNKETVVKKKRVYKKKSKDDLDNKITEESKDTLESKGSEDSEYIEESKGSEESKVSEESKGSEESKVSEESNGSEESKGSEEVDKCSENSSCSEDYKSNKDCMNIGVIIKASGEVREVSVDMTPYTNNIGKYVLNDKVSFIGQLLREPERTNAVLMYGKNAEEKGLDKNKGHVPRPFDNNIYGDIFILGMNESSDPENFTIEDFNEYNKNYDTIYKSKYFDT